ncbi:sugar phosphate isomerase/epimerase [Chitinophaga sp.]|uniref:sugar phosphate isomerase/epimerase family protein n=1 Tax=Chitinophaga sp. TaxID=1869181 RepID=UPI0031D49346
MTTRRTFLAQAGLLGAGLAFGLSSKGVLAAGKINAKAGLQLYSLREELPKDVKGVIAKVAAAGYKQVETYGYSKKNGFWGLSAQEFKTLLTKHGLTSPSGHYGLESEQDQDDAIEAAKILGQEYLTMPYIDEKKRKTAGDISNLVAEINKLAEKAKQHGLKMAYHNHDFEFQKVDGVMLYEELLKGTNPSLVHFEMDIYWVVRSNQDPVAWINKYPGRFTMVHVKDMDKANPELNTEVGKGSINFKSIFAKAKTAGLKYYIVEQENFSIDPYVSITQSAKYLRTVLFA